ncbi:sulfonate ABC transporter substrate-binding protein [Chlorogloeopsis sp. ULAP01]|uniref:sulfonate ABC transporter substrate-binding protein n=1 Tax=Chlorogloeopsis sp. ULAP01 TaxID=3056483 RepID=UPI0025AB07B1|nr:sulfonate ABC transporter substrate-binding protein [Chlorogloeopsis sp. ULAP01]MDM9384100.1 sulfonate ABC transporter substrate-binding protein [Chlorogloeopsis sp. ULAP01]
MFFSSKALKTIKIQRFSLVILPGLLTISTLTSCAIQTSNSETKASEFKTTTVNMGYQSSGDIVRLKGVLEKRLTPLGVKVDWAQFPAGPQLMEAMNVGKVDMGSVGETPPIFAQVAGTSLVYVARRKPSTGEGSGIIVRQDSSIRSLTDLKGKKVVFQKGSASHYLLIKALEEAGLKYSDIQPVSMPPSEARAAFIQGKIDAWVTWDPHLALAQKTVNARILRDASGIATQGGFYMAARTFATENPELVRIILEEIDKLGQWAENNTNEVAKLLTPELKVELPILEIVTRRRTYRLRPINQEIMDNQQRIADLFYQEKVIPKQIDIKEAMLTPKEYSALTPDILSQK